MTLSLSLAKRSWDSIRGIWQQHADKKPVAGQAVTLIGACVTVRAGKGGKMLFVELLDGSTVRTLQCICDSAPDDPADPRLALDWAPLFEHCHRGATVQLSGTLVDSPAAGQPFELIVKVCGSVCFFFLRIDVVGDCRALCVWEQFRNQTHTSCHKRDSFIATCCVCCPTSVITLVSSLPSR